MSAFNIGALAGVSFNYSLWGQLTKVEGSNSFTKKKKKFIYIILLQKLLPSFTYDYYIL